MRWVAAISTLLLLCIAASGLTIAAPTTPPGSIDAEVEATLGTPAAPPGAPCVIAPIAHVARF